MTRFGWMYGAWLVPILGVACADPQPAPGANPIATELAGRVVIEGPKAGRRVVLSDLREGVPGAALGSTLTDEEGAWSLVLGPVDGLVRVDVFVGAAGEQRLSAAVDGLSLGEKRSGVQVTPVTHLHSILLEALRRTDGWDGAVEKSSELLFGHFGGVDHRRVAAADLFAGAAAVSDEHVVALLLKGLSEQAEHLRRSGAPEDADSTTSLQLVEAYARDLEDGVFDGRNRFGGLVTFAGHPLTSFWLRSEYADTLDAFTHRTAEQTGIDSDAIQSILTSLRTTQSELFPAAETVDSADVTWVERKFMDDRGFEVASGVPFRGSVELHVVARSGVGIRELRIEGEASAAFGADREPRSEELWAPLETSALEDGDHAIEVVADTAVGAFRTRMDFSTDNHPPELTLGELRGPRAEMTLTGTVSDSSFPVTLLLAVGGVEQGRVEVPQAGEFSATITIPCGTPLPVSVTGVDRAGNHSEPVQLEAFCDEDAPSLILEPSFFIPETEFELEPDDSGEGVTYRAERGAMRLEISETATQPFHFAKFYNRLDADPQGAGPNLPIFRLRASDGPGAPAPSLAYRYLVDGVEERGWTPLAADDTGRVTIPISYQSMSTKLATHANAAHTLEVRAVDPVGNETTKTWGFGIELLSPPLWVSNCRPAVIAWGQLHSVFQGASPTEFYSGALAYPLDLPAESLTPPLEFQVDLGESEATTEIPTVRYIKFQDSLRETTWPRLDPILALCQAAQVDLREQLYVFGSGIDELCLGGRAPSERLRPADRDWAPSQSTSLSTALQVGARDSAPLAVDAGGSFPWPWGHKQLQFGLTVEDPHVLLGDGSRYGWMGTYDDVFPPTANTTDRYWLPTLTVEGTEVPAPLHQEPPYVMRSFRYVPSVAVLRTKLRVPTVEVPSRSLPLDVPVRWATECTGGPRGVWTMEWRQ